MKRAKNMEMKLLLIGKSAGTRTRRMMKRKNTTKRRRMGSPETRIPLLRL